jgi:energy-coupling factor transporter ATP-binding protein EcfA2
MDTFDEIYERTSKLPDWQRDAIRRITTKEDISEIDYEEVILMLDAYKGSVLEPDIIAPTPIPVKREDFVVPKTGGPKVILNKLYNVKNVNALMPGQEICFGVKGITVVYGQNASGKSGYARVLKRACRSRDKERILPNVYMDDKEVHPAKANIDVTVNDEKVTDEWIDEERFPEYLKEIAVFDSKCARLFIDEDNKITYLPYGFDIFHRLVKFCEDLKIRIEAKRRPVWEIPNDFLTIYRDTKTGNLLSKISWDTRTEDIESLSALDDIEKQRLNELTEIVKADDPLKESDNKQRLKSRIGRLVETINELDDSLSEELVKQVRNTQAGIISTGEAAKIASELIFTEKLLPGVGTDPWKEMFRAAQKYSMESAYPGVDFPVTEDGSRCVLCQQVLDTDAKERLVRFWDFIISDIEKELEIKKNDLKSQIGAINKIALTAESVDPEIIEEIATIDCTVSNDIRVFLNGIKPRIKAINAACENGDWSSIPSLPKNPSKVLESIGGKIQAIIDGLVHISQERNAIVLELTELRAREYLAKQKDQILNLLQSIKVSHHCDECVKCLTTKGITQIQTELMDKAITGSLKHGLLEEFETLGVHHTKLSISNKGVKGSTLFGLELPKGHGRSVNVSDVLSEGEQRAAAIASFLAEIKATDFRNGIVFDDPVSSLDHIYRERVAKRLVEEGKGRQVIIFTHDIFFLYLIREQAAEQQVPIVLQSVERKWNVIGKASGEIPWMAKSVKDRISELRESVSIMKDASKANIEGAERDIEFLFYDKLRSTWERLIEEVLLNDTIQRFRTSIETKRLNGVVIENDDFTKIFWNMKHCSDIIKAHDHAISTDHRTPDCEEMEKDLNLLAEYSKGLKKRRDSMASIRNSLIEAPVDS